jgi:ERCC4-type nuclease
MIIQYLGLGGNSMSANLSKLTISVTKPKGKPASMLAEKDIELIPIEEDEGNVDRYIISKRLALERRTGSSFLRGIVEKTLFTSAIYLKEHFDIPILIVEGEVNYECSMFNPQAVRGALSAMILQYGLNVISTSNLEETVELIAMITRQEQIGIAEISLIPKRKAVDLPDMQRRVIEMLPGCGMVMAREMLQHFGSVSRIINATEEELREVKGVGAKKAAEIYKVLNSEYEAVDTERNLEDAISVAPELIFCKPVEMLDRQHYIYADEKDRHIIDLVFLDPEAEELILVELKRGKLLNEHEEQLLRYLSKAYESELLRSYLEKGVSLRGILATVEECKFNPKNPAVSVCIVDKNETIGVLKQLREQRGI